MNDMWNEDWTELCRQKFINRMYKFPTNPTYTLNMGAKMPVLGFGTWRNQQVSNVVQRALRRGLRSCPDLKSSELLTQHLGGFNPGCPCNEARGSGRPSE